MEQPPHHFKQARRHYRGGCQAVRLAYQQHQRRARHRWTQPHRTARNTACVIAISRRAQKASKHDPQPGT